MAMRIHILPALADNYVYLLTAGDRAAVVDPGDAACVEAALPATGARLEAVLLTHSHADHTGGCAALVRRHGCRVIGPSDPRLPQVTEPAADGDVVTLGSMALHVLAVPGHTRSHVAYHAPAAAAAWTGDTLFTAGCGRVLEGSAAELWQSLRRLAALPDDTALYGGHTYTVENLEFAAALDPTDAVVAARLDEMRARDRRGAPTVPSPLREETRTNPFLRAADPAFRAAIGLGHLDAAAAFAELRRRKDRW